MIELIVLGGALQCQGHCWIIVNIIFTDSSTD